jgi:hypothetical protein
MLSGDIIQVFPDRKQVSFLYSYSNYIPLPASAIERHGPRRRRSRRARSWR